MKNIHKFNRFKYYSEKAEKSEQQGDLQDRQRTMGCGRTQCKIP